MSIPHTDQYYVPTRLDDMWQLGIWDVDVAIIPLFCIFAAFATSSYFFGAIIVGCGLAMGRQISRSKFGKHPARVIHAAHWLLPRQLLSLKRTPPATVRELIG